MVFVDAWQVGRPAFSHSSDVTPGNDFPLPLEVSFQSGITHVSLCDGDAIVALGFENKVSFECFEKLHVDPFGVRGDFRHFVVVEDVTVKFIESRRNVFFKRDPWPCGDTAAKTRQENQDGKTMHKIGSKWFDWVFGVVFHFFIPYRTSMKYAISKTEINDHPLLQYTGEVLLIREDADVAAAVSVLKGETLLGFDTETRPAFKRGQSYLPSLLQLAGEEHVYLFQLQRLTALDELFALLENPAVIKAGVAVRRDVEELKELHEFKPAGFQDVGHIAEKKGFRNTGLRPLTALLLDHRISKGAQVSNWASETLSEKQIVYAATDAWISRKLYVAIQAVAPNPDEDL